MTQLDDSHTDTKLLKNSQLPTWMDPDHMYFFKCENDNDNSEFIQKVSCKDIQLVEATSETALNTKTKGNYCFRIELKDKIHFFGLEYATECNNWIRSLKKGKRNIEEVMRTEEKKLRKNIDYWVWLFRQKRGQEVVKLCIDEFKMFSDSILMEKTKVDSFISTITNAQLNYWDVLDALQAYRPFYQELFRLFMETYHKKFTDFLQTFYNKRFKEFGVPVE